MGSYLVSVVVMTAFIGLISYLSYPGASERAIKVVSSILIIYTVCIPVVSFAGNMRGEDFFGEVFDGEVDLGDETYMEVTENAFKRGIAEMISSKYGINKENIKVYVYELDFERMAAGKIKIILTGKSALFDWRVIEQYINESGLGKCEVLIDFEQ